MPKPDYHVFVCSHTRPDGHPRGSCASIGSGKVLQGFANSIMRKKLLNKVSLTQTACLGPCQSGVSVLVYPDGVMYSQVEEIDIEKIIDQHLVSGVPYQEKMATPEVW